MNRFPPEGSLLNTPANRRYTADAAGLNAAYRAGAVLEAPTLLCTREHELVVSLAGRRVTMDRNETARGLDTGETRTISILSRVGKSTCFVITGFIADETGAPMPVISRRAAQEQAWARLNTLPPNTVIDAVVTHLAPFGAFVDVGCGLSSMIGVENISVARISSPADRFHIGQRIHAVVTGVRDGHVQLSHRELLGTWSENAARFRAGETVAGIVRGVKDYGIFIELAPNLSGLAEYRPGLRAGDRVSVYIKIILPEKQKVKLVIIDTLPPAAPAPLEYFITGGNVTGWRYDAPPSNP